MKNTSQLQKESRSLSSTIKDLSAQMEYHERNMLTS